MKTTNIFSRKCLTEGHVVCPYCHKHNLPHRLNVGEQEANPPITEHYYGVDTPVICGIMVCGLCSEAFLGTWTMIDPSLPYMEVIDYSYVSLPLFNCSQNLTSTDLLTEIEVIFKRYDIDLIQLRPYSVKMITDDNNAMLLDKDGNSICNIFNIDVGKFISNNINVLEERKIN